MLDDANMRFDYLVIDGNTDLNNPISSIGMTEADKLLVVHRPSVKDCLWHDSMRNVFDLLNLSYKTAHILNAHDKSCDLSAYKSSIGLTFDFELGYVENANIYANTGQAIVFHDLKQEREYISGMKALTSSVILGGDSNMDVFNINDLIYKVNINTTSDTSNQQTMEYKDVLDKIRHIISKITRRSL